MKYLLAFLIAFLAALPAAAGCPRPADAAGLAACAQAANGGDGAAALVLGDALGERGGPAFDAKAALAWWGAAHRLGETQAARRLHDAYVFGRGTPVDAAAAETFLQGPLSRGETWALLVRAMGLEAGDPAGADALYRRAAEAGNCRAQLRLVAAYDKAEWGGRNQAQAYLWALIAGRPGNDTLSHPLFDQRFGVQPCSSEAYFLKSEVASTLPAEARAEAERAAAAWKPGLVPEPQAATGARAVGDSVVLPGKTASELPDWKPLPPAARRVALSIRKPVEDLFAQLRPSVWVVVAARDEDDLKAGRVSIGSAVAVTEDEMLTNCHVVENYPFMHVKQGERVLMAEVSAADIKGDRCRLRLKGRGVRLAPVAGWRAYGEIKVGEPVLTIGAPRGLEATLGQGHVSAVRARNGLGLVQLTAPISNGSSGGGLFDAAGNLMGITTFLIRDSQGLNFAIAADEFLK